MQIDEFSVKYAEIIDVYCVESVGSLEFFLSQIEKTDIEEMPREIIILVKMIHEMVDSFKGNLDDSAVVSLHKSINKVIASNAIYLPELFVSFQKIQQQKLLAQVVENDD